MGATLSWWGSSPRIHPGCQERPEKENLIQTRGRKTSLKNYPQKKNCDTKPTLWVMNKNKKKVTNTGELGGPSVRQVGGGSGDASAEECGHSAPDRSGPMSKSHGSNPITGASTDSGKGREGVLGFKGWDKGKGKGKGKGREGSSSGDTDTVMEEVRETLVARRAGRDEGRGRQEEEEGGQDKGKGRYEGKGHGEEMEVEDRASGKKSCSDWENVCDTWREGERDSRFHRRFDRLFEEMLDLEWTIKEGLEEAEYAECCPPLSPQGMQLKLLALQGTAAAAVNQLEQLGRRVYAWEARGKVVHSHATEVLAGEAQLKKEMGEKDRRIEELEGLLKRMEGEGSVPRMMVERSTSPIRDPSGDLRALVREVVREELGGMEGMGSEGRGIGKARGKGKEQDRAGRLRAEAFVPKPQSASRGEARVATIPAVIEIRDDRRSYAGVMRTLRKETPLETLGVREVNVRVTTSGVTRVTLLGEGRDTACRVASSFKQALGEGARVSCPCPMREVEVAGFDPSILEADLVSAIQRESGSLPSDIRVGRIGRTRGGAGRAWVRLPAASARKLCREGIRVEWTWGRVYSIGPRPVQCLRCLGFGHVQARCAASVVTLERGGCHNCSSTGHRAATCCAPPCCAACRMRGWPANHRMGGAVCHTVSAYIVRTGPSRSGDLRPPRGSGAAADCCPPDASEEEPGGRGTASVLGGDTCRAPPLKPTAAVPPVGGPGSGLPPEGLDPGEGSMDVEED